MATLGISEFTFGYAFLFEQTQAKWGALKAAPVLPSLQQEAEKGWDAHLPVFGADFYYQFKLADRLSRSNARYIRDGTYSSAYYRMALHRHASNNQHRRLKAHALLHPDTYYVAPEVRDLHEFNTAFLSSSLAKRTRLIPVAQCKEHQDDLQHYITFQDGSPAWTEHSEPIRHEQSFSGTDTGRLYISSRQRWRSLDLAYASDLFEKTREYARRREEEEEPHFVRRRSALLDGSPGTTRGEILRRAADILSAYVGVTLVLVGEPSAKEH